jgi:TIR domain
MRLLHQLHGADRVWAEWIAWRLEAAGYTTVLQAWDFRPGDAWVTQMQAAMTTARRTIAVLSPDYLSSVHGAAEWQAAYAEDPDGSAGRLVPVRVRECRPEGLLATRTWIDLIGLDADGARDALLASIERRRAKPSREPAFPGTVHTTPFPES